MFSLKVNVLFTPTVLVIAELISLAQSNLHKTSCGKLYDEPHFGGNVFKMKDSDSFSNLGETYATRDTVWNVTKSLKVENGCSLTACNESYFDGVCQEFRGNINETPLQFDSFLSVNCICARECKCNDVIMSKSSCARAYISQGCNTCNALYTEFQGKKSWVPDQFKQAISSIIVKQGCSLAIYEEDDFNEDNLDANDYTLEGGIFESWNRTVSSYDCTCPTETNHTQQYYPKIRPLESPPFIDMPLSVDNLIPLLQGEMNGINGRHPGLVAALRSIKGNRSPRNAYILFLGLSGAGKSSAIKMLFGIDNVYYNNGRNKRLSISTGIRELRIPIPIDHLGIQNSELRIIHTPGLGDTRGLKQDAKFLATLSDYLDGHEELSKRIPNIVFVFATFHDNIFRGDGSMFVKMLRGVDAFRDRITDKNFSNVIFVLSHYMSETKSIRRRPSRRIQEFQNIIEQYSLFPKPISIAVAENRAAEQELLMLNGFYKLPNGDFYPKNLIDKIELVTDKGNDPIGQAVIQSVLSYPHDFNVSKTFYPIVDSQHSKVSKYLDLLYRTNFKFENTEVSHLLKAAYDSMNKTLANKFPDALPYLQRCFNIRNIFNQTDIPRTNLETVKINRDISQNKATSYLLEKAFGLKAPKLEEYVTGQGYDVIHDCPLFSSPFKIEHFRSADIGYLIPTVMNCKTEPVSKEFFEIFSNTENYVRRRYQDLNAKHVPVAILKGKAKPGSNIIHYSLNDAGLVTFSAVKEYYTFALVLNEESPLKTDFINTVEKLPALNISNDNIVNSWRSFFNEYGTHVVKSTHGGGSIEINIETNRTSGPEIAQSLLETLGFLDNFELYRMRKSNFVSLKKKHTLRFRGGDPKYHITNLQSVNLIEASEILQKWRESLHDQPIILTDNLQLIPIGKVANMIGTSYSLKIDFAAEELFESDLQLKKETIDKEAGNFIASAFKLYYSQIIKNNRRSDQRMTDVIMAIQKTNPNHFELKEIDRREIFEWMKEQHVRLAAEREAVNRSTTANPQIG